MHSIFAGFVILHSSTEVASDFLFFIFSSFQFLAFCVKLPFLLVQPSKKLIPLPQSHVCYFKWYTISTTSTSNTKSNTLWRGHLLCRLFLIEIRRWSRCSDPTVAIPPGVINRHMFLISPSYSLLSTSTYLQSHSI